MPTECVANPLQRALADAIILMQPLDEIRILLACGAKVCALKLKDGDHFHLWSWRMMSKIRKSLLLGSSAKNAHCYMLVCYVTDWIWHRCVCNDDLATDFKWIIRKAEGRGIILGNSEGKSTVQLTWSPMSMCHSSRKVKIDRTKRNFSADAKIKKQLFSNIHLKVNEPVAQGLRPLHYAVWQQHIEAIRLLLVRGADINAVDECGYSALHLCSEHG